MRVLVASRNDEAAQWLDTVLRQAGLSVVLLREVTSRSPELSQVDLLIADRDAASALEGAGPQRRMLLVPRGEAVDISHAMGGGFMDLVVVPGPEDEILNRVGNALDQFLKPQRAPAGLRGQVDELRGIAERITEALGTTQPNVQRSVRELLEGMLSVFVLLIDSHETTERATPGHSRRVGILAREMAVRLGHSAEESSWLELAGRLQDIGMLPMGLPLAGEAPLSRELRRELNHHPELSEEILEPLASVGLPVGAIRDHHERTDGSGYPREIGGREVSLEAQILGAADVYEALTSQRPWRGPETREGALEAMRSRGGFGERVLEVLEEVSAEKLAPPGPMPLPRQDDEGG